MERDGNLRPLHIGISVADLEQSVQWYHDMLDFELITEVGRKDAPGRPILFGTTEQFLRSFGVKSLTELPELNPDRMAQFREEAEKEVQLKLDI